MSGGGWPDFWKRTIVALRTLPPQTPLCEKFTSKFSQEVLWESKIVRIENFYLLKFRDCLVLWPRFTQSYKRFPFLLSQSLFNISTHHFLQWRSLRIGAGSFKRSDTPGLQHVRPSCTQWMSRNDIAKSSISDAPQYRSRWIRNPVKRMGASEWR